MALAAEKFYIRRGGVTQAINLYTSPSDVGSEYIALKHPSGMRYASIIPTSDSRASYLRAQRAGVAKAVALTTITYVGVWSAAGDGSRTNVNSEGWTNYTYYFNSDRIYGPTSLYNYRAITVGHADGSWPGSQPYRIDGVTYYTPASQGVYTYHRLSTGNHTISYYGFRRSGEFASHYYTSGQRVV